MEAASVMVWLLRFPREVVNAASLEILEARLHGLVGGNLAHDRGLELDGL